MSKTLVIHPYDETTQFLKEIYKDKDYDVITSCNMPRIDLARQIDLHDRIIMMGHGTGYGLLNPSAMGFGFLNSKNPYIIDDKFADLLRTKDTLSIWCQSDVYFKKHCIPGFHTGVIISECAEQSYLLGRIYLNRDEQLENMIRFSKIVGEVIDKDPETIKSYILENYIGDDPVTKYNRANLFII